MRSFNVIYVLIITIPLYLNGSRGVKFLIVTHDGVLLYNVAGVYEKLVQMKDMVKDLDYHLARNELYILTYRQILRTSLEGIPTHQYTPLVDPEDEYRLTSFAVDWVHDTLYWTSGAVFILHRAFLNGSEPKVILRGCYIEKHLNKILVDPYVRLLFWMTNNEVHSADLEGNNYRKNVFPEISSVRNIAMDSSRQRLYFLAAFRSEEWLLCSIRYDGKDLLKHALSSRIIYGLGGHALDVYWIPHEEDCCTWEGNDDYSVKFHLYTASSFDPLNVTPHKILTFSEAIWNLRIVHPDLQRPKPSPDTHRK